MTSRWRPVTDASVGSGDASGARLIERIVSSLGRDTRCTSRPVRICRAASTRDCSMTSAAEVAIGGLSASAQRPSFSMRMATGS